MPSYKGQVYNVKPTHRQRLVFENLLESPRNKYKAIRKAGYSHAVAIQPQEVLESAGFQVLLNRAGITDDFLNNSLYEDIKKKPQERVQELTLAYKLKGRLKNEENSGNAKTLNITNILNIIENKEKVIQQKTES